MTIEELKQWVLSETKRCRAQSNGHKANESNISAAMYDGQANAYNEMYQKLCIYFKD